MLKSPVVGTWERACLRRPPIACSCIEIVMYTQIFFRQLVDYVPEICASHTFTAKDVSKLL